MGGVHGMLAEMDRDATVARLQAGKAHWRGQKRVEGRWPYGAHPSRDYDAERAIVARIQKLKAKGVSNYAIARTFNAEGTRTRYGKLFRVTTIQRIAGR
jgi:DNA invertase Pin-like site-specific DNA recombinase